MVLPDINYNNSQLTMTLLLQSVMRIRSHVTGSISHPKPKFLFTKDS